MSFWKNTNEFSWHQSGNKIPGPSYLQKKHFFSGENFVQLTSAFSGENFGFVQIECLFWGQFWFCTNRVPFLVANFGFVQ
jgi:hypothetical protein